jgi:predicted NBD/HSP70 family sugar kinase
VEARSIRALSLDMGGTHIGCGLVEDERLLASTTVPSSGARGLNSLLGTIERALHSLLEKAGLRPADCAGLAMGFPGIVDAHLAFRCAWRTMHAWRCWASITRAARKTRTMR